MQRNLFISMVGKVLYHPSSVGFLLSDTNTLQTNKFVGAALASFSSKRENSLIEFINLSFLDVCRCAFVRSINKCVSFSTSLLVLHPHCNEQQKQSRISQKFQLQIATDYNYYNCEYIFMIQNYWKTLHRNPSVRIWTHWNP